MKGILSTESNVEPLYTYFGNVDEHVISKITTEVEQRLIDAEARKSAVKRTFSILIEGLQNSLIHSYKLEDEHYIGLAIVQVEDNVHLRILSLTDKEGLDKVVSRVDALNAMERPELKAHYLEVMSNGELSAKGGAGLGLITMALKSSEDFIVKGHDHERCVILESSLTI